MNDMTKEIYALIVLGITYIIISGILLYVHITHKKYNKDELIAIRALYFIHITVIGIGLVMLFCYIINWIVQLFR